MPAPGVDDGTMRDRRARRQLQPALDGALCPPPGKHANTVSELPRKLPELVYSKHFEGRHVSRNEGIRARTGADDDRCADTPSASNRAATWDQIAGVRQPARLGALPPTLAVR